MSEANASRIIYEQPLSERIRSFLRLEFLFERARHLVAFEDPWASRATLEVNARQRLLMVEKIAQAAGEIDGKEVGFFGLAFKPNTDDMRDSPTIEIIKALPNCELGLIYNFHHAHHQLDDFDQLVDTMAPYLWAVNLNGMRKDGTKILTIGKGDQEQSMIHTLLEKGFPGPFGILGHIEERDVEMVLRENLEGLSNL